MTKEQKATLAKLFTEFAQQDAMFGRSQINIRTVCAKVRVWAETSNPPNDEAVELLIRKQSNGIANVGKATVFLYRAKPSTSANIDKYFCELLLEMFKENKPNGRIDHKQYAKWKERFFAASGYKLEVIFNRLVFAIFPEQFCSVPKPERLLRICNALQKWAGLGLSEKPFANLDWFELCELIMPIVREAFPDKDYAARSTFLAAVGVKINKERKGVEMKNSRRNAARRI